MKYRLFGALALALTLSGCELFLRFAPFAESGAQCSDGVDNDGNGQSDCEEPACSSEATCAAVCGNNSLEDGEDCDDGCLAGDPNDCDSGDDGDGCDSNCTLTGCGNGVVTAPEQCDDGNSDDFDACKSDCTQNICGDGVVLIGVEQCDDGSTQDGDGCDNNCPTTRCGNGVITEPELCDDGNATS